MREGRSLREGKRFLDLKADGNGDEDENIPNQLKKNTSNNTWAVRPSSPLFTQAGRERMDRLPACLRY